jgi:hypothetical protein
MIKYYPYLIGGQVIFACQDDPAFFTALSLMAHQEAIAEASDTVLPS